MKAKDWSSKSFNGVVVRWRLIYSRDGFQVQIGWKGVTFVETIVSSEQSVLPFSIRSTDADFLIAISGVLQYQSGPILTLLDFKYPEGYLKKCTLVPSEPDEPDTPDDRPSDIDSGELLPAEVLVDSEPHSDLFPYLYLRTWPTISPETLQQRFIQYAGPLQSPPFDTLYGILVYFKNLHNREAMEQEAVAFIEGAPPFDLGQYIRHVSQIKPPLNHFPAFYARLCQTEPLDFETLKGEIENQLGLSTWADVTSYVLENQDYLLEKDRVWQNVFALLIVSGYRPELLDDLIRILVVCNLIENLALSPVTEGITSHQIREWLKATILLPEAVFPLPAYPQSPPVSLSGKYGLPGAKTQNWIEPYAIADLQMVRQRIVKYQLGEVAYIENILKGEQKKTTRRKLNRVKETISNASTQTTDLEDQVQGTRTDLINEVQKTLAQNTVTTNFGDNGLQTTYGPPITATVKGSWTVETGPHTSLETTAQYAREITTQTAHRIARQVSHTRTTLSFDETEDISVHRFDNRQGSQNVRGIYRWVNKVYSAFVVNYGHRLLIEFSIQNPAKFFIQSKLHTQGVSLVEPVLPEGFTFQSITRDNYAVLATQFEVKNLTPPPPSLLISATTFSDGEPVTAREIAIPDGYEAETAYVIYVLPKDATTLKLVGLVGRNSFECDATQPSGIKSFPLNQERKNVPAAATCHVELTSPPQMIESAYLVNIEIECRPTAECFEDWQLKTYAEIMQGYNRQRAAYYQQEGVGVPKDKLRNPLALREIEKNELRRNCFKLLLDQFQKLVGGTSDPDGPTPAEVNEPRYLQFFEQVFEWNEMAYSFYSSLAGQPPLLPAAQLILNLIPEADQLFTMFLQAKSARILVPVRPECTLPLLYYLSSGLIWVGQPALTPCFEQVVSIVNEYKTLFDHKHPNPPASKPWEIIIPTSMVMLQDTSELPNFQRK